MSEYTRRNFDRVLSDEPSRLLTMWSDVDLRKAGATKITDLQNITALVEKESSIGGFDRLNEVVRTAAYEWGCAEMEKMSLGSISSHLPQLLRLRQKMNYFRSCQIEYRQVLLETHARSWLSKCVLVNSKYNQALLARLDESRSRLCLGTIDLFRPNPFKGQIYYVHESDSRMSSPSRQPPIQQHPIWKEGRIVSVEEGSFSVEFSDEPRTRIDLPIHDYDPLPQQLNSAVKPVLDKAAKIASNCRYIEWKDISREMFMRSPRDAPGDYYHSSKSLFASGDMTIDYYISHSWQDEPTNKYDEVKRIADDFFSKNRRYPTFFLDVACLNSGLISDPLYLDVILFIPQFCANILALVGATYFARKWCVLELILFKFANAAATTSANVVCRSIDSGGNATHSRQYNFIADSHCFDPNEEGRINLFVKATTGETKCNEFLREITQNMLGSSASRGGRE